ncbi:GGDEF domain-containing protein [Streptomyces sp. NPDC019396]|uniref:GGDEF domain-containing protein n=1 Tax=Streptomyces sp. NPDC019396 TaxID=3154687 RepID=UPI0033DBD601
MDNTPSTPKGSLSPRRLRPQRPAGSDPPARRLARGRPLSRAAEPPSGRPPGAELLTSAALRCHAYRVAQATRRRTAATAPPAVLFVDLDGFKEVNDAAGHAAGDDLLVQAARRLPTSVRAGDTVARFGGDEFAAPLEGGTGPSPGGARAIAESLLAALMEPYRLGDKEAMVSASIGIALATPGITPEELLQHADLAHVRNQSSRQGLYSDACPADVRQPRPTGQGLADRAQQAAPNLVLWPGEFTGAPLVHVSFAYRRVHVRTRARS